MRILSPNESTVNSFYLAFYGRPADPEGLHFWSLQLAASNGDLTAITQAFSTSEEAQVRFGADDLAGRITEIYQQLFNRAPEAAGLAYWTEVVEQGHASLADVAVIILKGAQDSDSTLAQLRQQAADAFTAAVETGGTEYSGYAAIEAARILVRAVTLDATPADLDLLVKAAVSFADTATRTPQVVEAIAVNTTLLALFDTARGMTEPVGLAQALADTAKAAAGDPVTLDSLLRGGGMDKVLKVMPPDATLKDVVDALASGGLPAAIEVVYPTKPVTPPPAPEFSLAFDSVTQGDGDRKIDNVTKEQTVDVKFSYTGNDLKSGQHFEYTIDGKNWIRADDVATGTNTVTLEGIDLGQGTPQGLPLSDLLPLLTLENNLPPVELHPDLVTTVTLRAVDAGGNPLASSSQAIVYDSYAAAPTIVFNTNATDPLYQGGGVLSNKPGFTIDGVEDGAKVEFANTKLTSDGKGFVAGEWMPHVAIQDGPNTFYVRQTDAAGNESVARTVTFTFDSVAPNAPAIALSQDTGASSTDKLTSVGAIAITGLDADSSTAWQYSTDLGASWSTRTANDGSGAATLMLNENDGIVTVLVRQIDAAGNTSIPSAPIEFTLDTTKPATTLSFGGLDAPIAPGSNETLADTASATFTYSANVAGESFEWRLADGQWAPVDGKAIDSAARTITIGDIPLASADQTVELRAIDAAGNRGDTFSQPIDGPAGNPTLQTMSTANGVWLSSGLAGKIYLSSPAGDQEVVSTVNGGAVAGEVTVGAQQEQATGVFKVVGANGKTASDQPVNVYTLGTNGADVLEGGTLWGFGGDDTLRGTGSADTLYGGAGADRLSGGAGGDRFLIAHGDSVTPTIVGGVTTAGGIDVITDFNVLDGDTIMFGPGSLSYSNLGMTVSTTFYASLDALTVAANDMLVDLLTYGTVFAGQVGRDVYVVGSSGAGNMAFMPGLDPIVKLENFSVLDLGIGQIRGLSGPVHHVGDGTVFDGSNTHDELLPANKEHAVYVRGLDGMDIIDDSMQDDVIIGGAGADSIYLFGGADTLVVDSGRDSNLAHIGADVERTYDSVYVHGADAITFDFGVDVQHAYATEMGAPAGGSTNDLFDAITLAYTSVATGAHDAVLMNIEGTDFLIVDDGDGVIGGSDIAIRVVGTGLVSVDGFGNVVYSPLETDPGGIAIPG